MLNKLKISTALTLTIVLGIVFLSFWPSLFNGFVSWDDNIHLYENETIRTLSWASLKAIFSNDVSLTYIPLTSLSFAVEYHFFGYNPVVYHFNNLLLHLFVTALIFGLARRLTHSLLAAAVSALLFGIHPMHVESVAWVTERKDVLYAVFYVSALHFYWSYLVNRGKTHYAAALLTGFLSILAKPMALSLPLVLCVLDGLHGRRFDLKSLLLKVPFCILIFPVAWWTYSLNSRAIEMQFPESMLTWLWTFVFYLKKFIFPFEFLPLYQLPKPIAITNPEYIIATTIVAALVFFLVRYHKNRWLLFAFLYYFVSIFFLLRFDDRADLSIVADRFMYLPSLGFCILAGVYFKKIWECIKIKAPSYQMITAMAAVVIVLYLGVSTFQQTKIWNNGPEFWTRVINRYPTSFMAYNQRALSYKDKGDLENALRDYTQAIALFPRYDYALTNRGIVYKELRRYEEAWNDHSLAIAINPDFSEAYLNRGNVSFSAGDFVGAIADYDKAIINVNGSARRNSTAYRAEVYSRRGAGFFFAKDYDNALKDFDRALEIDPNNIVALDNRAIIFSVRGENGRALQDFNRSLQIAPDNPATQRNLQRLYYQIREVQ